MNVILFAILGYCFTQGRCDCPIGIDSSDANYDEIKLAQDEQATLVERRSIRYFNVNTYPKTSGTVVVTALKAAHSLIGAILHTKLDELKCPGKGDYETYMSPKYISDDSNRSKCPLEFEYLSTKYKIEMDEMFLAASRVAIFRDPFDRSLSAYYNSLDHPGINAGRCDNASVCSFGEWVDEIKVDGQFTNSHLIDQVSHTMFRNIHYHYVYRLSSSSDMDCFFSLINASDENVQDLSKNPSKNSDLSLVVKAKHFTPAILEKFKIIYSEDIVLWKALQRLPGAKNGLMEILI